MALTLEDKEKFLRNRSKVKKIILNEIRKEKAIIFGARAVNKQIPKHLRTHTDDFDVLVEGNPKKLAKRIERRLDKKFGGNFYSVEPASHEGTEKIRNNLSGKGVVDISKRKDKVSIVRRRGVKFATLKFQEKKIRESLANPEAKFRHQKDRFTRDRIKLARQHKTEIKKGKIKKSGSHKKRRTLKTNFSNISSQAGISRIRIGL